MPESGDAIAAVTSSCPWDVYASFPSTGTLHRDDTIGVWIAVEPAVVREVLEHPDLAVRPPDMPVPEGLAGSHAGDIFAAFARMSEGDDHFRRKAAVTAALEHITPDRVTATVRRVLEAPDRRWTMHELQFEVPVMVIGELLGVAPADRSRLVEWTSALVRAAAPGASGDELEAGRDAASGLTGLLSREGRPGSIAGERLEPDERVANEIGFLFQTHDATAGLIGILIVELRRKPDADIDVAIRNVIQRESPVHNTRRYATKEAEIAGAVVQRGESVLVLLAPATMEHGASSFPFGHGRHSCPGEHIARAIARSVAVFARDTGTLGHAGSVSYHPSTNARIPDFRISEARQETI